MFVQDFKKIQIKPKTYPSKVTVYKWDQKSEKLKKEKFDWQVEIDKNKHVELKEMLKKNLLPETTKKGVYADITPFKGIDQHKVFRAATNNVMFAQKQPEKVDNKVEQKVESAPKNEVTPDEKKD